MVLTMTTGQEDSLLLLLPTTSPQTLLLAFLALAAVLLWLSPGGPAWALSRCCRPPAGPAGVVTALSSPVAHRTLAALSSAVDGGVALMSFSVGLTRLVVASQPDTAREILVSPAFGDRPVKDAARHLLFHRAMGFAPSGDAHWRGLRRLAATHLFGPRCVAGSAHHRTSIGARMVSDVAALMGCKGEVSLRRVLHGASLNHIMATVFGKHYDDFTSQEGALLEEMVTEGYDLLGTFNWADHLPLLKWLDLQGVRHRCNRLVRKVEVFVGKIIQEHKERRASGGVADEFMGDFVDVLLGLEGEEKMSDSDMIAVLWEMIFRGADTVAILMEWIMARMVLHPDIQAKAQAELDAVVGRSRGVADADVVNLPYIRCIVKETLRMHPPGPLLSWARLAVHDAHVGGHLVPAGTTAMVNMWAIAHDAAIWPEPEAFRPERFQEEDVSVLGSDLRLAPFGAGRRVCPGKMLALATTHLWLAQLLHHFEWAPAAGGVDLSERLNMSLEMATQLVCKAAVRGLATPRGLLH
ncbi:cytochrome P450 78A5-like [Phragmites australis]|uniref:cytochrome P450 78A5-like n=1 Tax=Phragmites australis TaxID=29695 RepID=UPI002D78EF32|nr:cytochrome P450 78A5-like [Phragmites australis]